MSEKFVDPYLDESTGVLRNKLNIADVTILELAERRLAHQAAHAGMPRGDFDAAHVQTLHKHLFGKVYPWAGQLRTDIPVMQKGSSTFCLVLLSQRPE